MAQGLTALLRKRFKWRLQPSYAVPSLAELDLRIVEGPVSLSASATSPARGYRILNLRRCRATAAPKFLSA